MFRVKQLRYHSNALIFRVNDLNINSEFSELVHGILYLYSIFVGFIAGITIGISQHDPFRIPGWQRGKRLARAAFGRSLLVLGPCGREATDAALAAVEAHGWPSGFSHGDNGERDGSPDVEMEATYMEDMRET